MGRSSTRLVAIWSSTIVLISGGTALGQLSRGAAFRPSQDGPLTSLSRTLGRLNGAAESGSGYNLGAPSGPNMPPPSTGVVPKRAMLSNPSQTYDPMSN